MESLGLTRRTGLSRYGAKIVATLCGVGLLLAAGLAYTTTSGATSATVTTPLGIGATSFGTVTPLTGADTCGGVLGAFNVSPNNAPVTWSATGGMNGNTGTGGDLYCVSVAKGQSVMVTLSVTNTGYLSQAYSNLSIPVNYWTVSGTTPPWTKPSAATDQFLTLINGYVTFTLPTTAADAYYEVAVDGNATAGTGTQGSFYCFNSGTAANLSPLFYAQVTAL